MIQKTNNKMENGADSKNKFPQQEFHFPGQGEFKPQTILATSSEEAEAEYIRTREPVAGKVEPDKKEEQQ